MIKGIEVRKADNQIEPLLLDRREKPDTVVA